MAAALKGAEARSRLRNSNRHGPRRSRRNSSRLAAASIEHLTLSDRRWRPSCRAVVGRRYEQVARGRQGHRRGHRQRRTLFRMPRSSAPAGLSRLRQNNSISSATAASACSTSCRRKAEATAAAPTA